jgi:hypothetical protein
MTTNKRSKLRAALKKRNTKKRSTKSLSALTRKGNSSTKRGARRKSPPTNKATVRVKFRGSIIEVPLEKIKPPKKQPSRSSLSNGDVTEEHREMLVKSLTRLADKLNIDCKSEIEELNHLLLKPTISREGATDALKRLFHRFDINQQPAMKVINNVFGTERGHNFARKTLLAAGSLVFVAASVLSVPATRAGRTGTVSAKSEVAKNATKVGFKDGVKGKAKDLAKSKLKGEITDRLADKAFPGGDNHPAKVVLDEATDPQENPIVAFLKVFFASSETAHSALDEQTPTSRPPTEKIRTRAVVPASESNATPATYERISDPKVVPVNAANENATPAHGGGDSDRAAARENSKGLVEAPVKGTESPRDRGGDRGQSSGGGGGRGGGWAGGDHPSRAGRDTA